jgi:ribonuclease P protein component
VDISARRLTLSPPLRILAGLFSVVQRRPARSRHEAPLSTEQPASQADPRVPCTHGHQGRPPRPEPAPGQGPQAPVGLTARGFQRPVRLVDKPQFDAVYKGGHRSADPLFLVVARKNAVGHARLGLSVGVKAAGGAVSRNRIKRLVRESFRLVQQELPPVDLVVNARSGAAKADNREVQASLAVHWQRICARCVRS